MMLTEEQRVEIHKDFRKWLRTEKNQKGTSLDNLMIAAETHLPELIKTHISLGFTDLYSVEDVKPLVQYEYIISSHEDWQVQNNGYTSLKALVLYDEYFALKHGLDIGRIRDEVKAEEDQNDYVEGGVVDNRGKGYERDPESRRACLRHYRYTWAVCGFNFEEAYGEAGHNFIEVHHLVPVSQRGGEYHVDPIHDLRPVC